MKHLYLLRHADASWELAGELDFQRGLTERGIAQCELMRGPIAALAAPPGLVLCSGSRRTRETLDHVAAALPKGAKVEYDDRIYRANVPALIELLREIDAAESSVMVIGHNPTMHDLAVELAEAGEELSAMAGSFPKAALAELEVSGSWSELAADAARLTRFTRPKELKKQLGQ